MTDAEDKTGFFHQLPSLCIRVWLGEIEAMETIQGFAQKCGYEASITDAQLTIGGQVRGGFIIGMDPVTIYVICAFAFFGAIWPRVEEATNGLREVNELWGAKAREARAKYGTQAPTVQAVPGVKQLTLMVR